MLFVFCFVSFCNISFSQTYNFIEPVNLENPSQSGGVTSININSSSFGDYINNLYVFVIVIICLISVFMLMRGGITYLTSNITNDVKRGKEIIIGVISGLVFIFCIYLIFYLVSPRLLTSNFILGVLDSVAQDAGVPSVENTTGGAPPSSGGTKSTGKGVIGGQNLCREGIVSVGGKQVCKSIENKLQEMLAVAKKDGITLSINEGYRSEQTEQKYRDCFNNIPIGCNKDGHIKQVTKPGTISNHTKGIAVDFNNAKTGSVVYN